MSAKLGLVGPWGAEGARPCFSRLKQDEEGAALGGVNSTRGKDLSRDKTLNTRQILSLIGPAARLADGTPVSNSNAHTHT